MKDNPFAIGFFKSPKHYREWRRENPNCTCDYSDYRKSLEGPLEDCPQHGEFGTEECAKVVDMLSKAPVVDRDVAAYDPPPSHYDGGNGLDNWAIWDAYDLDRYTANAVKYILRAGKKSIAPRLDDLIKARNYINKAIEMEQNK